MIRSTTCRLATVIVFAVPCTATAEFTTVTNVPPDVSPTSIGSNTQLNLFDGGMLRGELSDPDNPDSDRVFSAGSLDGTSENVELNIFGGETSEDFLINVNAGAVVNMTGGSIYDLFALQDGIVNVSDGELQLIGSDSGGIVNISGGEIERSSSFGGPTIISAGTFLDYVVTTGDTEIFGGSFQGQVLTFRDTEIFGGSFTTELVAAGKTRIYGGSFEFVNAMSIEFSDPNLEIVAGGTFGRFSVGRRIHAGLLGSHYLLDGEEIPGLTNPGDSIILSERGGALLTGIFADGSPFDFVLNDERLDGQDFFSPDATLRLTLVPEPSTAIMAALAAVGFVAFGRRRFARG